MRVRVESNTMRVAALMCFVIEMPAHQRAAQRRDDSAGVITSRCNPTPTTCSTHTAPKKLKNAMEKMERMVKPMMAELRCIILKASMASSKWPRPWYALSALKMCGSAVMRAARCDAVQ
jgi:hypothetical protein